MAFENLVSGAVFVYPYLWSREAAKGETEGRKDRPVVVGVRVLLRDGLERLVVFPITSLEPGAERIASEIPDTEKKRLASWRICAFGSSSTKATSIPVPAHPT
jgi:hypothetical protein